MAIGTGVGALVLGGIVGPLALVLVGAVLPALIAGVLPRLVRAVLILTLPLAVSVLIVNLLFFPGGQHVIARIGPITATSEGLAFALEVLARLLAISSGITLFYLTTTPGELTIDLERRGVSPRIAFVALASVQTVPAMIERAVAITDAQRARGLDTQGSVTARLRGIVPIVGPVIVGSIGEVEERTMALEARGFGRPGRRTLLWHPSDSRSQVLARWAIVLAVPGIVLARAAGWIA